MPTLTPQQLDKLSPFELNDLLIEAAERSSDAEAKMTLNAGRGNPKA